MDLLEYRAMKAQEEAQKNTPPTEGVQSHAQTLEASTPIVPSSDTQTNPSQSTPIPPVEQTETQVESNKPNEPQLFDINGEKVTLEELQRGYLRQSDYTRKTQELSRQVREAERAMQVVEQIKQSPELQQQLNYDPNQDRIQSLEQNYYDLLLEREVNTLSTKYPDFEVTEVLDFALNRKLDNLEDAYLLNKQYKQANPVVNTTPPSVDVEALRAQIRAELEAERNTSTIISTNGGQPPSSPQDVQLSEHELRVAQRMRMTPEEYAKWR